MVEAEVGSLIQLLPIPVLVTSESGDVLRANPEAAAFLDLAEPLIGKRIEDVLRQHGISVRMRLLHHDGRALRLYVLQAGSDHGLFCQY